MKHFCVSVSLHANLELLSTLNMKEKSETSVKGHKHQHNKRNVRLDLLHVPLNLSVLHNQRRSSVEQQMHGSVSAEPHFVASCHFYQ